ncbi:hypothetical protein PR048_005780 [Dryococelus australis]|uniref:Uncharacterized protein n=1 Tax=Dryococelus australis TaxID=614101 RepID=A0ABQ9I959_9NEOP|nr:hypothetical protein PR048_005780 [Dryococelus australis]
MCGVTLGTDVRQRHLQPPIVTGYVQPAHGREDSHEAPQLHVLLPPPLLADARRECHTRIGAPKALLHRASFQLITGLQASVTSPVSGHGFFFAPLPRDDHSAPYPGLVLARVFLSCPTQALFSSAPESSSLLQAVLPVVCEFTRPFVDRFVWTANFFPSRWGEGREVLRGEIWATLNIEVLRASEGDVSCVRSSFGMQERGKQDVPEKTRRPTASSGTIPTCENPGCDPTRNRTRFALVGGEQSYHLTITRVWFWKAEEAGANFSARVAGILDPWTEFAYGSGGTSTKGREDEHPTRAGEKRETCNQDSCCRWFFRKGNGCCAEVLPEKRGEER